jgi:hypothetical protein
MDDKGIPGARTLAFSVGGVAAGSAISIATYFAIGGPFGTLNDLGNAAIGLLSATLAWRLRRLVSGPRRAFAVGAAIVGAAVTLLGTALVVSGTTGWFIAGLVSSIGFAGIGAWLIIANRSPALAAAWPAGPRWLGVAAGGLMVAGIAAAPGVVLGLDDAATAPAWAWIGFIGWLGTYVGYPAWALWLGIVATRRASGDFVSGSPRAAIAPRSDERARQS